MEDIDFPKSRHDIAAENREEVAAWIDERADELIAQGRDAREARRIAIEEFGNVDTAVRYADRQDAATERRLRLVESVAEFASDMRIATRSLTRTPVIATVVLLTLALGVGATTAVFSLADAILLRPLPYGDEDTLVYLAATDDGVIRPGLGGGRHSGAALVAFRERSTAFSAIAGVTTGNGVLRGVGDPEQVWAANVTPNTFDVLQAKPVLGRTFVEADSERRVVILLDGLWRRRFNSDPAILGRTIDYGGELREVIGVMPAGFRVPTYENTELVTPQTLTNIVRGENSRNVRFLRLFGRVKTTESPQADMDRVVTSLRADSPRAFERLGVRVVPIRTAVSGDIRPRVLVLMTAAAFLLLLACANVAGVLLSRGLARRRELAVRVALGAGRLRLIRHFLAEGAVLACAGTVAALLVGQFGITFFKQFAETTLPAGTELVLDRRVVWFGVGATLATALIATLLPALTTTRRMGTSLRLESARTTPSSQSRRLRLVLVAAQLTVAVVLLIGAGLLVRTMQRLAVLDLGYQTSRALTFRPQFTAPKSNAEQDAFYSALYEALRAIPGVVAVGGGNVPTGGVSSLAALAIDGRVETGRVPDVRYTPVSDDYFTALGVPLVRGRVFGSQDRDGSPWVAVVSEGLATQLWPGADPIGARVRPGPDKAWATIVGVVGDVRMGGSDAPQPSIYTSQRQDHWPGAAPIVVRAATDPVALVSAVRDTVRRVDPTVVIPNIRTLDDIRYNTPAIADRNVQMQLMVVFSVIALVVSAIGVYGMTAYAAQSRTMEFGIRVALGAPRSSLLWLAIRDSVRVALIGAIVGIPVSWLLARRLREVLFAVPPFDLPTVACAGGVLVLVVMAAAIVPARRAAVVDPTLTIRAE